MSTYTVPVLIEVSEADAEPARAYLRGTLDRIEAVVSYEIDPAGPKPYSVSVQSSSYSTDWNDVLIVLASAEWEAKELAETFVRGQRMNDVHVAQTEAYLLTGESRVMGRLINTDEE